MLPSSGPQEPPKSATKEGEALEVMTYDRTLTAAIKPLVLDKARIAKWIENKTKRPVVEVFIHRGSSDYHIIAMTNHEDGPAKYEIEVKAVWEPEGLALVPAIRGLRLAATNYQAFEDVRERVQERLAAFDAAARRYAATDLSTPDLMGKHLRERLHDMFPKHYVEVVSQRGVRVNVARLEDEAYVKEQWQNGFTSKPNLQVSINILPDPTWTSLSVKPAAQNEELDQAGIKPIRKAAKLTPEKAADLVLKWFAANRAALSANT
jgi:hypothetical protein